MSETQIQNKALVRRIYEELWNKRDLSVASELFSKPEGVHRFVGEFLEAFPDLQHTVEELIAEGDRVVACFSAKGTHTGQWKGYKPSEAPIDYSGVTIARIKGSKITHHHTWWEALEVIEKIKGA